MYDIDKRNLIPIGRQGENAATSVQFDASAWLDAFPSGSIEAVCVRPGDDDVYPVDLTRNGSTVIWLVSAYETEHAGLGSLELRLVDGDVLKKSTVHILECYRSLSGSGADAPAKPSWVTDVMQAGETAKQSAESAQASEAAALLASNTAVESAQAASVSAQAAAESASAAVAAQGAAESAAQRAESRAYGLHERESGLEFELPVI